MRNFSTPSVDENVGKGVQSGGGVKAGNDVGVNVCVGGGIVSAGNGLGVGGRSEL